MLQVLRINLAAFFFILVFSLAGCGGGGSSGGAGTSSGSNATGTSDGQAVTAALLSKEVPDNYPLSIYLPKSAVAGTRLPVVYVLDGERLFEVTKEAVTASGRDAIVVAIGNTANRLRDYLPGNCSLFGAQERYFNFIRNELIPYVDKNYSTTFERILVGHSYGGNFVIYAMFSEGPQKRSFTGYLPSDAGINCSPDYYVRLRDTYKTANGSFGGRAYIAWATAGAGMSVEPYFLSMQAMGLTDSPFVGKAIGTDHVNVVSPSFKEGIKYLLTGQ